MLQSTQHELDVTFFPCLQGKQNQMWVTTSSHVHTPSLEQRNGRIKISM